METMIAPKAQSQLPKKLLHGFVVVFTLLLFGGGSFYGGYQYAWYKLNWANRLLDKYSFGTKDGEGFYKEAKYVVLFGTIQKPDFKNNTVIVSVLGSAFAVKTTPETQLIEGSSPIFIAEAGDAIVVDMKHDQPFIADKMRITKRSNSN